MHAISVHETVSRTYVANVFGSTSVTCILEQPHTASELLKP